MKGFNMGKKKKEKRGKKARLGQSMLEFALVFPIMLLLVMTMIEVSRMFQAWLAVGYAARQAARFAVTGSPPMMIAHGPESCQALGEPVTGDPYALPSQYQTCRVDWIKYVGREAAKPGLYVDDLVVDITKPYFLDVYVRGFVTFSSASPSSDHAGAPRTPVEVTVVYNHPVTNPLLNALLPTVRITRIMRMVNEPWDGGGVELPPELPTATPLPPLDTDGDGWSDIDERDIYGTLPGNPDTDNDGYFDGDGTLLPVDPEPLDPCIPGGC
jgi:hypothetical protein